MMDFLGSLRTLDVWAFHLVNRSLQNPLFDWLMPVLSAKRYALIPAAVAIFLLARWGSKRAWILVGVGVLALGLTDLGANLLKGLFERTRPCHVIPDVRLLAGCTRSFSLPSNHASNMFALATVAWLGCRRWRWALPVLAAGVACSRIYLGVHYPSDVIAGALWGSAVGCTCTWAASRIWPTIRKGARHPTGSSLQESALGETHTP